MIVSKTQVQRSVTTTCAIPSQAIWVVSLIYTKQVFLSCWNYCHSDSQRVSTRRYSLYLKLLWFGRVLCFFLFWFGLVWVFFFNYHHCL